MKVLTAPLKEYCVRTGTVAAAASIAAVWPEKLPPGATWWALTVPELYFLHIKESSRSPDAYQRWLADVLIAVLLAH